MQKGSVRSLQQLEKQNEELKKQLMEAKREALSGQEVWQKEVRELQQKMSAMQQERDRAIEESSQQRIALDTAKALSATMQTQCEKLQLEVTLCTKANQGNVKKHKDAQKEVAKLEGMLARKEEECQKLAKSVKHAQEDLDAERCYRLEDMHRYERLRVSLEELSEQRTLLEEEKWTAIRNGLQSVAEVTALRVLNRSDLQTIELLKQELHQQASELEVLYGKLLALQRLVGTRDEEIKQVKASHKLLEGRLGEVQRKLATVALTASEREYSAVHMLQPRTEEYFPKPAKEKPVLLPAPGTANNQAVKSSLSPVSFLLSEIQAEINRGKQDSGSRQLPALNNDHRNWSSSSPAPSSRGARS